MPTKFQKINKRLINQSEISRITGLSQPYISRLLKGTRGNEKAKELIRKAITEHIKF